MNALPKTMAAVLLTGHGGFDKLEYREDVPVPQPKMGEVLIRVLAAGVNNTDINTRIGDGPGVASHRGLNWSPPKRLNQIGRDSSASTEDALRPSIKLVGGGGTLPSTKASKRAPSQARRG